MLKIPVLRWGQPYASLDHDKVVNFVTGETLAEVSQANPGLLAKDMKQAPRARSVLREIPMRQLIEMMKKAHPSLRRIVAFSAEAGLPAPALSSALGYFDGYRQARGTSNLIQAQRDFFGAHGFERIGEQGAFHGPWGDEG